MHGLDDLLVRAVPKENEALGLLKRYAGLIEEAVAVSPPELTESAAAHIYDLAALALGATREAGEIAQARGVPAARRAAAEAFVREHLNQPGLRAAAVAAHLGVTPRYAHMLFERAGRSFLEYVLDERLMRAHRMLLTHPTQTVTTIALAAGFNDLSYFNRTFRRRFGCTPTEVRAEARREPPEGMD